MNMMKQPTTNQTAIGAATGRSRILRNLPVAALMLFLLLPTAKADYGQVVEVMGYDSTKYELVNLLTLNKDGAWNAFDSAWSVESLGAGSNPNNQQYRVDYDGTGTGYVEIVVAMTGMWGSNSFPFFQDGILWNVLVEVNGNWLTMRSLDDYSGVDWSYTVRTTLLPDGSFYPNGGANTNENATHFFRNSNTNFPGINLFEELIMEGAAWELRSGLSDNFALHVFAVKEIAGNEVPEPATLAVVALGLAGLGLARRRRS